MALRINHASGMLQHEIPEQIIVFRAEKILRYFEIFLTVTTHLNPV